MEGVRRKVKRFDKDFKLSAVKMITEGGHKPSEVARGLDIHPNIIYSWKRKFANSGEKAFPGKGHLTELAALRRQLREAEMERDILKKQIICFINHMPCKAYIGEPEICWRRKRAL